MHPKMSVKYATDFLGVDQKDLKKKVKFLNLGLTKNYFGHEEAKEIFALKTKPKIIAFQIVKGGTGKTSLASSFAIRASLFGLKVLCIDLDQQANLTQSFNIDAVNSPVMVDILADGFSFEDSIKHAIPGIDLLPSRFENSILDDVIKSKNLSLGKVYRSPLTKLKKKYDLIVIDCPPNLGASVASATLASDLIVAPVIADSFALSGLEIIVNSIKELCLAYKRRIPLSIVLNKYDPNLDLGKKALDFLKTHKTYSKYFLEHVVRYSQEFPNSVTAEKSIYDDLRHTVAKEDVDLITRKLLNINPIGKLATKKARFKVQAVIKKEAETI